MRNYSFYPIKFAKYILMSVFFFLTTFIYSGPGDGISSSRLINVDYPINSPGDDFCPSITSDGSKLVFSSKIKGEEDHNIFITESIDGGWKKPVYFHPLNSSYNDETPFITPDGTAIVFSSDRVLDKREEEEAGYFTYSIYISLFENNSWTKPVLLPGDVNSIMNEKAPSLSADKKYIYFTRYPFRRPGESKVYSATLVDGRYRNVKEMSPVINSGHYDTALRPSITRPGFYFSSRRPGGFGGWDIYFTEIKDGRLLDPVNLMPPVNSEDNDLFITETGNEIFLCSNRGGGFGLYDIYSSMVPKKIIFENTAVPESSGPSTSPFPPPEETPALPPAPPELDPFMERMPAQEAAIIERGSSQISEAPAEIKKPESMKKKSSLKARRKTQAELRLFHPLFFKFNSGDIELEHISHIHDIMKYLDKNPNMGIKITGSFEKHGAESGDSTLGRKRAGSIADYLNELGLSRKRIEISGAAAARVDGGSWIRDISIESRRVDFSFFRFKK